MRKKKVLIGITTFNNSYQPTSFHFKIDETGERIYDDHRLNIVQENLKTIYNMIDDVRIMANINILDIQNNINVKTVPNPTTEIIGLFASKMFESIGVFFMAGTPAGIIATIVGKLVSAIITTACKAASGDATNDIQRAVNDIKNCMNAIFNQVQVSVTHWLQNMELEWNKVYHCNGDLIPDMKGDVTLSDLGNCDWFFPKKGESEDYIIIRNFLTKKCNYLITRDLLPVKWKIKQCYRAFPSDEFGNLLSGWNTCWYKVRNRSTWDSWSSHSDFPNTIPNDLRGDIEGPFEDIEKGSNYDRDSNGNIYYYQWWPKWNGLDGPNYNWANESPRWMNWSGKSDRVEKPNQDLVSGTSFLDFIKDILDGRYFADTIVSGSFPNEPSYFLWYETKRPNENVKIINDKRKWTLLSNDACKDIVYDSNSIFTWGRAYRGVKLHHYYLVDEKGDYAPSVFCNWLFSDDGHGNIKNENGIAGKIDVYMNWGLSKVN